MSLAHVENRFRFEVDAPMEQVAPLFAPEAERGLAGADWDPVFCLAAAWARRAGRGFYVEAWGS